MKDYRAVTCPLCEYSTRIASHSYGEEMARSALINHLCRKTHGQSRANARTLAKAATIITMAASPTPEEG